MSKCSAAVPTSRSKTLVNWHANIGPAFILKSVQGGLLVVSPLRAALAQELGQPVAASVVYRMLARHGWRKVAPDTRHPKSDPLVQEEWKETSPKHWQRG